MGKKSRPLTDMQWRFVHEYIVDLNAKQAAHRAGYSAHTCEQIGYQLLQIPSVRGEIDMLIEQANKKAAVTRERILDRLTVMAFTDITEIVSWNRRGSVKFKTSGRLGKKAGAVREFTDSPKNGQSIKLADAQKALETLWEKMGFDRNHSGRDRQANADAIRAALDRVKSGK